MSFRLQEVQLSCGDPTRLGWPSLGRGGPPGEPTSSPGHVSLYHFRPHRRELQPAEGFFPGVERDLASTAVGPRCRWFPTERWGEAWLRGRTRPPRSSVPVASPACPRGARLWFDRPSTAREMELRRGGRPEAFAGWMGGTRHVLLSEL